MKKYDIWKFEITFENCETIDILPTALIMLSFTRDHAHVGMCSSLHGMLVVEEECIDNVYIKISLENPKAFRQFNPMLNENPLERLKNSNDITHITINEEYLAVPFGENAKPYTNSYQSIEIDDEFIKIRIKKPVSNV